MSGKDEKSMDLGGREEKKNNPKPQLVHSAFQAYADENIPLDPYPPLTINSYGVMSNYPHRPPGVHVAGDFCCDVLYGLEDELIKLRGEIWREKSFHHTDSAWQHHYDVMAANVETQLLSVGDGLRGGWHQGVSAGAVLSIDSMIHSTRSLLNTTYRSYSKPVVAPLIPRPPTPPDPYSPIGPVPVSPPTTPEPPFPPTPPSSPPYRPSTPPDGRVSPIFDPFN